MAITPLSSDLDIIAALSDNPVTDDGLTSAQFKAKFDQAGNTIKTYLNNTLSAQVAEKTHTHTVSQITDYSASVASAISTHNTANDAHSTLFSAKENTLDANQKRHIFISTTEPADWVDGDIWLKSSS